MTLINVYTCNFFILTSEQGEMGSSVPSLRTQLLLLGLAFSHVSCQGFLPEIRQLTLPSLGDNKRVLFCQVRTLSGFNVRVHNAEFYLNGTDVRNRLTGSDFESSTGQIIFHITPDLEGCYTCGNATYVSPEEDALKLVCKRLHTCTMWWDCIDTYYVHK